ncbi:GL22003 [Drosophila persimilis]|uniref:trypsin n=1 Tax=Drosophila persimilis TaxID=7234 RepID=B4GEE1_DROPE|nr:seminase [Drosophila persimilis]EDW33976.1 GL22003 [Drosophila persimilis]
MNPIYRRFLCLQLLLLLARGLAVKPKAVAVSDSNLHVRPAVRTVNTNGFQLTEGGDVGYWLVHIMNGQRFICGASYYSALYVLTSANCMYRYRKSLNTISVEYVNPRMDQENKIAHIESVSVPKNYQYPDNYMDIAVVKLRRNLTGSPDTVRLCSQPLRRYPKFTAVACGVDPGGSFDRTATDDVAIMPKRFCQPLYNKDKLRISETIACVREWNNYRYRMYEFGCPVTAGNNELCGIVAWGPQFESEHPGLFTDIYQVKGFILKVVRGVYVDSRQLSKRTRRIRPKKMHRTWAR